MASQIDSTRSRANSREGIAPLDAARALATEVSARAAELEAARRLPADLARMFAAAGLFRIAIPQAWGGFELHPSDMVRVIEEVSRADGSAGWCVMIGATTAILSGLLPERGAREIYATDPLVITGGAVAPTGKARVTDGGYLVSGRWQWGSGAQNCQWMGGGALVMEGEQPRRTASGDVENRYMVFAADQVEILDTWNSSGLRGTGSHDFQVREAFVPADRSVVLGLDPPVLDRPLYRLPLFGLFAASVCAVALGLARRAIDEFIALAVKKTPTYEQRTLAESSRVQATVGEAEAALRSSRAFLLDAIEAAWGVAAAGSAPTMETRRDLRLAAANAAWQSARAVDLMYHAGGGSSVHASSPLQRCFRDVHVVTQHFMVNSAIYDTAGRLYLGVGGAPPSL